MKTHTATATKTLCCLPQKQPTLCNPNTVHIWTSQIQRNRSEKTMDLWYIHSITCWIFPNRRGTSPSFRNSIKWSNEIQKQHLTWLMMIINFSVDEWCSFILKPPLSYCINPLVINIPSSVLKNIRLNLSDCSTWGWRWSLWGCRSGWWGVRARWRRALRL